MKKETLYTTSVGKSERCNGTTKTWFSGFLSIPTKAWRRLKGLVTVTESDFNRDSLNGLWTSKKGAKAEAKKKMADLGGVWGVVSIGNRYCEVEISYFKVHKVKPVWLRMRDRLWLTIRG
jgi:hypothetical protein